jgi:hypothetical protein
MRTLIDTICTRCRHERIDVYTETTALPACRHCGAPTERLWKASGTAAVIGDDIPGGIDIRHGLCHEDGTPKRYYAKSEIARAAKAKGFVNRVEHVPSRGSDKNPHTQRWV